jgi:hypothetical protein
MGALARNASAPSRAAITQKARQKFRDSFLAQTNPDLPIAERQKQADELYRLHMSRLSRLAAKQRKTSTKWHKVGRAIKEAIEAEAEGAEADEADADADAV